MIIIIIMKIMIMIIMIIIMIIFWQGVFSGWKVKHPLHQHGRKNVHETLTLIESARKIPSK